MNLIQDLSLITTISESHLRKLVDKSSWIICNDCIEGLYTKSDKVVDIDIGIGILYISLDKNNIRYKFIPSEDLNKSVIKSVVEGINPLKDNLEESLKSKIVNVYKELL